MFFYLLLESCDLDPKLHHFSDDILQSKKNNAFICNTKIIDLKFKSMADSLNQPLKILNFNGWIENATTYEGDKVIHVDNKLCSVIIDLELDKKLELNKTNYNQIWSIYHNESNSVESVISNIDAKIKLSFKLEKGSIHKQIELKIIRFNPVSQSILKEKIGILTIKYL